MSERRRTMGQALAQMLLAEGVCVILLRGRPGKGEARTVTRPFRGSRM